jgi:hypothetical protein
MSERHPPGKITRRRFLQLAGLGGIGALISSMFVEPLASKWDSVWEFLERQPYLRHTPSAPDLPGQSSVFHVEGMPVPAWDTPYHEGLEALLVMMAGEGLAFYRSDQQTPLAAPDGLFAADDVVLVKVSSQWAERGMTNTDLLRGLLQRLVDHPDGFRGEVVVVENGQEQDYLSSFDQNNDDSPDHSQSAQAIVNMFPNPRVSLYRWIEIGRTAVGEYNEGDGRDGYVLAGSYPLNYPKFTTAAGTHVSLRLGLWDGERYDASRLKFINLPVLKAHVFMGATAAVKNYAGVMSRFVGDYAPGDDWDYHASFYRAWKDNPPGLLGRLMVLRFPTLTILDGAYVNPETNWAARFDNTPHLGMLFASLDPIALDYYAVKEVLFPMRQESSSFKAAWANPEIASIFRRYLLASQARLLENGYTVRFGQGQIHPIRQPYAA